MVPVKEDQRLLTQNNENCVAKLGKLWQHKQPRPETGNIVVLDVAEMRKGKLTLAEGQDRLLVIIIKKSLIKCANLKKVSFVWESSIIIRSTSSLMTSITAKFSFTSCGLFRQKENTMKALKSFFYLTEGRWETFKVEKSRQRIKNEEQLFGGMLRTKRWKKF